MKFTYPRSEKLKSKKTIELLFKEGKTIGAYPLRLFYVERNDHDAAPFKTGVSVSKKNFKLAVHRNKIKRQTREAYRLNKAYLQSDNSKKFALMFLYVGKEKPSFDSINKSMQQLIKKFVTSQQAH